MALRFVPQYQAANRELLQKFLSKLGEIDRFLVITGAGVSTESGIPDYRSEKVGLYERSNHRPMTHQEFMKSEKSRKRYWARNFLAWPTFSSAQCNTIHHTLSSWERSERFAGLITQNVDGLHSKAGSNLLTELHGCGHRVRCMSCHDVTLREDLQSRFRESNPSWTVAGAPGEMAPDGDVFMEPGSEEGFNVPNCSKCGGILKTDVVFFGDNVRRTVVDSCYDQLEAADAVLVLGSSLSVMSGYRFVYHASLQNKPIFIVNIGPTRADHLATIKLSTKISDVVVQI